MASKERSAKLYKQLLEAALDQPQPTQALKAAVHLLLITTEHNLRPKPPFEGSQYTIESDEDAIDVAMAREALAEDADTVEFDEAFMNLLLRPDC